MAIFLEPWNTAAQTATYAGLANHAIPQQLAPCATLTISAHETLFPSLDWATDSTNTIYDVRLNGSPLIGGWVLTDVTQSGNDLTANGSGLYNMWAQNPAAPMMVGDALDARVSLPMTGQPPPAGYLIGTAKNPFPAHSDRAICTWFPSGTQHNLYFQPTGSGSPQGAFNTTDRYGVRIAALQYEATRNGVTFDSVLRTVQYSLTNPAAGTLSSTAVLPGNATVIFTATANATGQSTFVNVAYSSGNATTGTQGGYIEVAPIAIVDCPPTVIAGSIITMGNNVDPSETVTYSSTTPGLAFTPTTVAGGQSTQVLIGASVVGSVTVNAVSSCGGAVASCTFDVMPSLAISSSPSGTVNEGTPITLTASGAVGVVQWSVIAPNGRTYELTSTTGLTTILQAFGEGEYQVIAQDDYSRRSLGLHVRAQVGRVMPCGTQTQAPAQTPLPNQQHPPAQITNNLAPFNWNVATQTGNIPALSITQSAGVLYLNYGGTPVAYAPLANLLKCDGSPFNVVTDRVATCADVGDQVSMGVISGAQTITINGTNYPLGVSSDAGNVLVNGLDGRAYLDCEAVQDCVGQAIAAGVGLTYDDAFNAINAFVSGLVAGGGVNISPSGEISIDLVKCDNTAFNPATDKVVTCNDVLAVVTAGSNFDTLSITTPATGTQLLTVPHYEDLAGNQLVGGETLVQASDIKKCDGSPIDLTTDEVMTCNDVVAVVTPASNFDTLSVTTPAGGAQILTVPHYEDLAGNQLTGGETLVQASDLKKCGGTAINLTTDELITCPQVNAIVTPASNFDTLSITTPAGGAQILTVPHYEDISGAQLTGGEMLVQAGDLLKCDNTPFDYTIDKVQTCLENATLADMLARTDEAKIVNPKDVHDTFETAQPYTISLLNNNGNPLIPDFPIVYSVVTGATNSAAFHGVQNASGFGDALYMTLFGSGQGNAIGAVHAGSGDGPCIRGQNIGSGSGWVADFGTAGTGNGGSLSAYIGIGIGTSSNNAQFIHHGSGNGHAALFLVGAVPESVGTGVAVRAICGDAAGTGSHPAAIEALVFNPASWGLSTNGAVFAAAGFVTSDKKLKRDIHAIDIGDASRRIAALSPATYEKRADLSGAKEVRDEQEAERLKRYQTGLKRLESLEKNKNRNIELDREIAALKQSIARDANSLPLIDESKAWTGRREAGFIAQEFAQVYPDAVRETPNGFLAIDQSAVIADLVATVQLQAKQIAELQAAVFPVNAKGK